MRVPGFAELPRLGDTDERHAWDVWGRNDSLGSVNRLTTERVLAAVGTVRLGKVINLDLPLNEPQPGLRSPYRHEMEMTRGGRDDHLDGFYLQGSSQIDGLGHVRHRNLGYWGGRNEAKVDLGEIGIDHWARHGLIGRGVLIDLARYAEKVGAVDYAVSARVAVDGEMIGAIARAESVSLVGADFILIHTGWLRDGYLAAEPALRRTMLNELRSGELRCPGLDGSRATAEWLWDRAVVGVLADNLAVEALPVQREDGFQHRRLIPLMGMVLGELMDLKELAGDCAEDGQYEFLTSLKPLHIPGAVGSPSNAYAIK